MLDIIVSSLFFPEKNGNGFIAPTTFVSISGASPPTNHLVLRYNVVEKQDRRKMKGDDRDGDLFLLATHVVKQEPLVERSTASVDAARERIGSRQCFYFCYGQSGKNMEKINDSKLTGKFISDFKTI